MSDILDLEFSVASATTLRNAHRRPHQPINSPAITRHIAIRRDESDVHESKWIDRIEHLILSIFIKIERAARSQHVAPTQITNLHQEPVFAARTPQKEIVFAKKPIELLRKSYFLLEDKEIKFHADLMPEESRYETVVISSNWNGRPLLLRFEVFEEYFTLSIFIEFASVGMRKAAPMAGVLARLNKNRSDSKLKIDSPSFKRRTEFLTKLIWQNFDLLLRDAKVLAQKIRIVGSEYEIRTSGVADSPTTPPWTMESFADFRGLLFGLEEEGKLAEIDCKSRTISEGNKEFLNRLRPIPALVSEESKLLHVKLLFPLLLSVEPTNRQRRVEDSEYTWSTFENDTALYGSCLGKSSSAPEEDGSTVYVVLLKNADDRSAGRIIGRLHTLGTVRTAALLDFDRVIVRDQILSSLDIELSTIMETRHDSDVLTRRHEAIVLLQQQVKEFTAAPAFQSGEIAFPEEYFVQIQHRFEGHLTQTQSLLSSIAQPNQTKAKKPKRDTHLEELRTELKDITNDCRKALGPNIRPNGLKARNRAAWRQLKRSCTLMLFTIEDIYSADSADEYAKRSLHRIFSALAGMNSQFKFSLYFRAERSRYHRNLFDALALSMDVRSVPGFQKYDEYVKHRLYRAFGRVESVIAKHSDIRRRADDIIRQIQKDKNDRRLEELTSFQAFGEIALILIIIPHYLGEELGHHLSAASKEWLSDFHIPLFVLALIASVAFWGLTHLEIVRRPFKSLTSRPRKRLGRMLKNLGAKIDS